MKTSLRLKNFPISFFAPILGMAGFTLALQKSQDLWALPSWIVLLSLGLTLLMLGIISLFYLFKIFIHFKEVQSEWFHPIKINFFPLFAKSLLVLSIVFLALDKTISLGLWITGAGLQFILTLAIASSWIRHKHFQIQHLSPAWFIAVVGNIIAPIAGVEHGFIEISWLFFVMGFFWMTILTGIIFYRLIFHDPVPEKLIPTFFILFAAPAIAFIAYLKLTGSYDPFARILYGMSLFLFLLLMAQGGLFLKVRFYLSCWAYSFPLAAFILANILAYHTTHHIGYLYLTGIVLVLLGAILGWLFYHTLRAIQKKSICIEESPGDK